MTEEQTPRTIYIGPSADDVRRILDDADVPSFMILDGDQGRPLVALQEGSVNLITSKLISALIAATIERDILRIVAGTVEGDGR